MTIAQYLLLSSVLFCIGIYGVLARKNGVMVLMSIELILNAVNINLVAFSALTDNIAGEVFALFVIAIAAAIKQFIFPFVWIGAQTCLVRLNDMATFYLFVLSWWSLACFN